MIYMLFSNVIKTNKFWLKIYKTYLWLLADKEMRNLKFLMIKIIKNGNYLVYMMITQVFFTWGKGNTFLFKTILNSWDWIDSIKSKQRMDLSTKEIQINQNISQKLLRKQKCLQIREDKDLPMEQQMLILCKYCCTQITSMEILIDFRKLRKNKRIK